MEWKNAFKWNRHIPFMLALGVFHFNLYAKDSSTELVTKQDIHNIRFISKDGDFTLYQRRSGDLHLSKHFKIHVVLEGDMGTQYSVQSSLSQKYLLITKHTRFHNVLNPLIEKEIYLLPYGKKDPEKIATGIHPRLHLNDTWLSYYEVKSKHLVFQNIENRPLNFKIKITNTISPYFVPQSLMLSSDLILYTDLNDKGYPGILSLVRSKSAKELIYKADFMNQKIELCLSSKGLLIGEFPLYSNQDQKSYISLITSEKLSPFEYNKREVIYESQEQDLGQIVCQYTPDSFYFIKRLEDQKGKELFEIASIDYKNKKIKIETEKKYITQLMEMDGRVIYPYQGSYYLLVGSNQQKENFDANTKK